MYLVKEAIDSITWRMTPVMYSPTLRQPLVAQLLNESSDLNTATEWKKKGGHLRATSISPKQEIAAMARTMARPGGGVTGIIRGP